MWDAAARNNPDLDLDEYDIDDLGPNAVGETDIFGNITLDDRYLEPLNENQMRDLYDTIIHEGLHGS